MMILKQFEGFMKTPPLWTNEQFGIQQFIFPKLELDLKPMTQPDLKRKRLGHQLEGIFKLLINHSKDYEVLIYNLPIRSETRTIGEIDFILKNKSTKELIHVELTYKFYLIDMSISGEAVHQLIGPNRKDLFFTKLNKIKTKQFSLLHSSEGINALRKEHINHEIIKHQACFKAVLFAPYQYKKMNIAPLNSNCVVGFWINVKEFNAPKFHAFQFYMPKKSEWVITPNNSVIWKSHQEIVLNINAKTIEKFSPMIWIKKSTSHLEKCFVVWW